MNSLFSKQTQKLKKNEIKKIIILKNSFWKFNIKSQKEWFKKNVKKNDLHNLLFFNDKLIGYTLLRLRKVKKTKIFYFLLDTMIVKKEFRKKSYGKLLMEFNNHLISLNNKIGFLICRKRETNFYKKFQWKNLSKKRYNLDNLKTYQHGMIFNAKSKKMFYDFN